MAKPEAALLAHRRFDHGAVGHLLHAFKQVAQILFHILEGLTHQVRQFHKAVPLSQQYGNQLSPVHTPILVQKAAFISLLAPFSAGSIKPSSKCPEVLHCKT
ncbi:MAG: hypothetical protein KAJ15_03220 [Spirochaetes bacterium]|nr:hypothetical protein [Spirochaetota bacterium]